MLFTEGSIKLYCGTGKYANDSTLYPAPHPHGKLKIEITTSLWPLKKPPVTQVAFYSGIPRSACPVKWEAYLTWVCGENDFYLVLFLRMPNLRILPRKVLGFRPKISAAPFLPSILHAVSSSTLRMLSRSISCRDLTGFFAGTISIDPSSLSSQIEFCSPGINHCPFNYILQFPNVPGPGVSFKGFHRVVWYFGDNFSYLFAKSVDEFKYKQRYVFNPLAQGW